MIEVTMGRKDFRALTEHWGDPMSEQQLDMANTRYQWALASVKAKRVLEIGCGSGFGMSLLRTNASSVIGGDITYSNLVAARLRTGLPVVHLDAHAIPFKSKSVDVVLLFESLYYLDDLPVALAECRRVLEAGGLLLACLPNALRPGFHPSPYSTLYPTVPQLDHLLKSAGFERTRFFGAYPLDRRRGDRLNSKIFVFLSILAQRAHLVPKTLAGRARVKRLLLGRLQRLEGLDLDRKPEPVIEINERTMNPQFRTIYFAAHN